MQAEKYDVIILGGSYAGLSAAMALGRARRHVLVIDGGKPANRFTPYSHNFLTHDGRPPAEIASQGRRQVEEYTSVKFAEGFAVKARKDADGFVVTLRSGMEYGSRKLIFATGIIDLIPGIPGLSECWGRSVLHCPYCHGYEVRNTKTGILGNGDYAFEFGMLISNWTSDLTVYTNGPSLLPTEQASKLQAHKIKIVEDRIEALVHTEGALEKIIFEGGRFTDIKTIYTRPDFVQHSDIPAQLGCELTGEGYIKVDSLQRTTLPGIFACGDNVSRMRTVANAVAMGTTAGMIVNKELVFEDF